MPAEPGEAPDGDVAPAPRFMERRAEEECQRELRLSPNESQQPVCLLPFVFSASQMSE